MIKPCDGECGSYAHSLACSIFSSHQQAWPTPSCPPSKARRGDSHGSPAGAVMPGHQAASRERYGRDVSGRCHHLNALMLRRPRPAPTCSFPLSLSSMQRSNRGGAQMGASTELSVPPSPSTTPLLWQGPRPTPSSRDPSLPRLQDP